MYKIKKVTKVSILILLTVYLMVSDILEKVFALVFIHNIVMLEDCFEMR